MRVDPGATQLHHDLRVLVDALKTLEPDNPARPDLERLAETALIVDTKYKLLDAAAAKAGVAEADAYQMFAYKERYRCPRVILLYPQKTDTIARDFSADPDSLLHHYRGLIARRKGLGPFRMLDSEPDVLAYERGDEVIAIETKPG